ncbi:MAG TPA: polysaccharide deacetylase family protein, partial [Pseudogracilibacillus sp.]|nr:polysaccharide deacetylase family protein [Pseudogracilibacillus sp.]
MLKQIKGPMALVIVAVALTIVVTFIGVIVMEIDKVTGERAVTVEVNSEEIDANVQLETEVKESKTYSTSISYPVTDIKEIDNAIDTWKKNEENRFKEVIKENEDPEDHSSGMHTLEIESNLYKSSKHLYSILLTGKEAMKNEKAIHFTDMFTFDLQKEKIIDLIEVIDVNESFLDEVIQTAKKLENEPEIDKSLLKETINAENWHSWILHDEELSLFFNDNEVGKYDGNIEINLPFVKIHEAITDKYYTTLITEEMQKEIENGPRELDPNGKYVALTFDDGPDEQVTSRILETLNEFDAKATFYMLGRNASTYPHIAKRVADEGHEIANHSITHANLNTATKDRIIEELTVSQQQIETATGVRPETFRPPYGE